MFLELIGDMADKMKNRITFWHKINHFSVKRKKVRTSLLARLVFLVSNVYLVWDVNFNSVWKKAVMCCLFQKHFFRELFTLCLPAKDRESLSPMTLV